MKKEQRLRTQVLISAALVTVAITIPFLPTMVSNVQDAMTARLVLTKERLKKNALKTYTPLQPSASPQKQKSLNYSVKKVVPVSNTLFFAAPSSYAATSASSVLTKPVVPFTTTKTSRSSVSTSLSSSSRTNYITLPSFIRYLLIPASSRSSTPIASLSSRSMSTTSSSSRMSGYSSIATTSSSSSRSSTYSYSSSTTTSSSSYWYDYYSWPTTTSSSSYTTSSSSSVATTSSSSSWGETLRNAANSSSSSICTAMRSTNGMCCDWNDSNSNGIADTYEPECNAQTTTSSSLGSLYCSPNPADDSDGDGVVNYLDPDCA